MEKIRSGSLYVVSTPIGNLSDVSYRAIHILKNVTLIASEDTRKTSILLKKYDVTTPQLAYHSYNQKVQTPKILLKLKNGDSVAIVSDAGTPGISDPAYALVVPCIAGKIPVIPVPGASAVLAALVVSGLPMNRFVFEGFLPLKKGRKTRLLEIAEETRTIVIYESPHRIKKTVSELYAYLDNRLCCLAREMTKMFEEVYYGSLAELEQHLDRKIPKGEYVIVIAGKE